MVRDLTEELNLVYVVDPFVSVPLDQGPLRYLRLHGHPGTNYKYTYTDAELERLKSWCTAETTYVMFNNVPMVQDAERFIRLLDGKYSGSPAILP